MTILHVKRRGLKASRVFWGVISILATGAREIYDSGG
jgi:hypothetical protein